MCAHAGTHLSSAIKYNMQINMLVHMQYACVLLQHILLYILRIKVVVISHTHKPQPKWGRCYSCYFPFEESSGHAVKALNVVGWRGKRASPGLHFERHKFKFHGDRSALKADEWDMMRSQASTF